MEIIYPKIHVYNNLIKDPEAVARFVEENAEWEPWWIFGKMAKGVGLSESWSTFPSEEQWGLHIKELKQEMSHSPIIDQIIHIKECFYKATKDYVETYDIELNNWVALPPSFNCYIPNPEEQQGFVGMSFHTDWQGEKADARGDKFKITCTMYLNDEYEGGEIAFAVTDTPEDESTYDVFKYRPKAGDIMVFPSTPPYHHGVLKVTSGSRYIVRNFWTEYFPGTPEWLAGEAEHGPEKWAELEKEREKEWHMTVPKIRDTDLKV